MKENKTRISSFICALKGIRGLAGTEINFKIELFFGGAALVLGMVCQLTRLEWAAVILCCMAVLALEAINTAVEKTVDLVTEEYKELARIAKDTAAGAVLIAAAGAACIGLLIFYPYIQEWLENYIR